MVILHITTSLGRGGAEAVLHRLTTGDAENAHHVISITEKGFYGDHLASAGIPVYALDMPRGRIRIKGIVKLYRLLRLIKPDLVQTWMYHADLIGGVVARLAGAEHVVWGIRGTFDSRRTSLTSRMTIRLCAFLSKWVPRIIVSNSEHAAELHVKAGYSPAKFVKIPNGYPLDLFRPDDAARENFFHELKLEQEVVLLGMVARLDPYKDHDNLFQALSVLSRKGRKVTCVLVGTGMVMSNQPLVYRIEKHGIQEMIRLIGPREDVPNIMAALDLHVLSSIGESFPNVLAEAMACGTPCVTTDIGDAALIVGDTGWVVPPSDPAALAGAIEEALDEIGDSTRWRARKALCRKRVVENFDLKRMIRSYRRVWSDAVAGRRNDIGANPFPTSVSRSDGR